MKNLLLPLLLMLLSNHIYSQCTGTDLVISGYMEGSGNNKCLTIYNPTSNDIDLTNYSIQRYANATTSPTSIDLEGTIPAGGEFTICNSSNEIGSPDQMNGNISHNGDDGYTLNNGNTLLDSYGQLGEDPGTEWAGSCSSKDQTQLKDLNVAGDCPTDTNFNDAFNSDSFATGGCLPINTYPEQITLPIKILSFTSKIQANQISLQWSTSSEKNNDYFEVQKSINGKDFNVIGEVIGSGTTYRVNNYNFIDYDVVFQNYYRLKQVDYDGSYSYSKVINVKKNLNDEVKILNTSVIRDLNVINSSSSDFDYTISSLDGKIIKMGVIGKNSNNIDCSDLSTGMYVFTVQMGKEIFSEKIIKI